jgi:hypothetical protein
MQPPFCLPLHCWCLQLKDEVQQLRSIVKSRDAQLAGAASSSATMKRDLDESRQQVSRIIMFIKAMQCKQRSC